MAELKEAGKAPEVRKGAGRDAVPRPAAGVEALTGWAGLPSMRQFAEEMDRMFEGMFHEVGVPWAGRRRPGMLRRMLHRTPELRDEEPWAPRVEMLEREGQIVIHAELPGLTKDHVKVEVSDEMVTIQGERAEEKREEDKGCYYNECHYGSFFRCIPLPEGADASKATAEFRNGVLEVVMPGPKRFEKKARGLEIKGS